MTVDLGIFFSLKSNTEDAEGSKMQQATLEPVQTRNTTSKMEQENRGGTTFPINVMGKSLLSRNNWWTLFTTGQPGRTNTPLN